MDGPLLHKNQPSTTKKLIMSCLVKYCPKILKNQFVYMNLFHVVLDDILGRYFGMILSYFTMKISYDNWFLSVEKKYFSHWSNFFLSWAVEKENNSISSQSPPPPNVISQTSQNIILDDMTKITV